MLIWSPKGRAAAGVVASVLFIVFFFLPLAVILMSSLSQQWNGILPSGFTLNHFVNALHGAAWDALLASLTIGFCASLFALLCGVWAALALRQYGVKTQKWLSMVFYLPSAIPSVSVGLGILVAFSQVPLQMNGTLWIVLTAHFVLISAFTFSNVSTGLARISADIENVASSLGGIALVSSASRDVAVIDAVDGVSAGAEFIALHGGVGRDDDDLSAGLDDAAGSYL